MGQVCLSITQHTLLENIGGSASEGKTKVQLFKCHLTLIIGVIYN